MADNANVKGSGMSFFSITAPTVQLESRVPVYKVSSQYMRCEYIYIKKKSAIKKKKSLVVVVLRKIINKLPLCICSATMENVNLFRFLHQVTTFTNIFPNLPLTFLCIFWSNAYKHSLNMKFIQPVFHLMSSPTFHLNLTL